MFKKRENSWEEVYAVEAMLLLGTLALSILGIVSNAERDIPSNPECLYIGLPILWGICSSLIFMGYFKNPISYKPFKKSGFIWDKAPYIFWIVKGCLESMYWGLKQILYPVLVIPIWLLLQLKYTGIALVFIGSMLSKIIQTIGIVFTMADGKAESKLKALWSDWL